MRASTASPAPGASTPWLALVLGSLILAFSAHQTVLPLAAVGAPILLLRFARRARSGRSAAVGLVAGIAAASAVSFRGGYLQAPPAALAVASLLVGLVGAPSYVLDRVFGSRLGNGARLLLFPCALTVAEYLVFRFGPSGTWGSLAYSQHGNLPLLQVLAVTGIWGITWLIAAAAPLANLWWEEGASRPAVRAAAAALALLALVEGAGSIRLVLASVRRAPEHRVAAVAPSPATYARAFAGWSAVELAAAAPSRRAAVRVQLAALHEDLLRRSAAAVAAGAELVAWPETVPVLAEDEEALLARVRDLAAGTHSVLVVAPWVVRSATVPPQVENTSVAFDADGRRLWRYAKEHLVPWVEDRRQEPGRSGMASGASALGRLAGAICYDLDFPWWVRQAGRMRAGLLVAPADDWPGVKPMHAEMAVYRGIENGVSVLRATSNGISAVSDAYGRVRGALDADASDAPLLVTSVPIAGALTPYSILGDWFAAAAALGLLALLGLSRRYAAGRAAASSR